MTQSTQVPGIDPEVMHGFALVRAASLTELPRELFSEPSQVQRLQQLQEELDAQAPTQIQAQKEPETSFEGVNSTETQQKSVDKLKKCTKCGEKKPLTAFAAHESSSDGHTSWCKPCRNARNKKLRIGSLTRRFRHHIATRVDKQCSDLPKNYVADLHKYLGYSFTNLVAKLNKELKASKGISLLEAVEKGYHLDHIYPLSKYDVEKITDQAFRDCWRLDNLKMIPAAENLAKSAKVLDSAVK